MQVNPLEEDEVLAFGVLWALVKEFNSSDLYGFL